MARSPFDRVAGHLCHSAHVDTDRRENPPGAGSDEVFDRAERLLGRNGIAEVLALLGYYSAVAMAVKLHRVPLPA